MSPEELTDRFVEIARKRAKKAGRALASEAEGDLRKLAEIGARKLLLIEDRSARDQAIEKAEDDIIRLVDLMIQKAMELTRKEDYPRDMLGERTFAPARLRFCPCPPFC